jgi:hypothetical protein
LLLLQLLAPGFRRIRNADLLAEQPSATAL